ncbi:MAG: hypothetical protein Q4E47_03510 [Candidatus Saccharibacteria bacterium]|nr:hypothetical protein [Candidatus Saccharibacteria bacterium]
MDNNVYQPGGFAFGTNPNPAPQPTAPAQPQPVQQPQGQPMGVPGQQPMPGQPMPQNPYMAQKPQKKINSSLIKTICLVLVSIVAVTFACLFAWMYTEWDAASTDVKGQVEKAVAIANDELEKDLRTKFEQEQKYPYKTFGGPADFGNLNFEYPRTWSVYIPDDARDASDYHAFLHPDHVSKTDTETVTALRVSIENTLLDEALEDYNDAVEDGEMTVTTTVVNGANVSVYTGKLPSNDEFTGIACLFKIRDKTVTLQTDAMVFKDDFYNLLKTVHFNS